MRKTITIYKDHTDDILSTHTCEENEMPSFLANAAVRFKHYPHIRYELKDVAFLESRGWSILALTIAGALLVFGTIIAYKLFL